MYEEPPSESLHPGAVPFEAAEHTAGRRPHHPAAGSSNNAIPAGLADQVASIERRFESLKDKPADALKEDLRCWATVAGESAEAALSAAHRAIMYAWATGCMFNLAKAALGRGGRHQGADRPALDEAREELPRREGAVGFRGLPDGCLPYQHPSRPHPGDNQVTPRE
jgi:hypothetical protein